MFQESLSRYPPPQWSANCQGLAWPMNSCGYPPNNHRLCLNHHSFSQRWQFCGWFAPRLTRANFYGFSMLKIIPARRRYALLSRYSINGFSRFRSFTSFWWHTRCASWGVVRSNCPELAYAKSDWQWIYENDRESNAKFAVLYRMGYRLVQQWLSQTGNNPISAISTPYREILSARFWHPFLNVWKSSKVVFDLTPFPLRRSINK